MPDSRPAVLRRGPLPAGARVPGKPGASGKKAKKGKKKQPSPPPPFSIKQYILDSLTSISKFFSEVFAGDFEPRKQELMESTFTFTHYT